MARFLKYLSLFILPITVVFIGLEVGLRSIPNIYSQKKEYLDKHASEIETLVLGSSHSYYGVAPRFFSTKAFNAAMVSQSLDLDHQIYSLYLPKMTALKQLIIPIDCFSLHKQLSSGNESWRVKNYNIYYEMDVTLDPSQNFELLSFPLTTNISRLYEHLSGNDLINNISELGYAWLPADEAPKVTEFLEIGISSAKRHTHSDTTFAELNLNHLSNMLDASRQKGVKVLLYTSPALVEYTSHLNADQVEKSRNRTKKLCADFPNCKFVDLMADSTFVHSDFWDPDHLNVQGAEKLSLKLDSLLQLF